MTLGCLLEKVWSVFCTKANGNSKPFQNINKGGVPFHRNGHGGVDTGSEGDVDEGHQDGDQLEQGEVLVKKETLKLIQISRYLPEKVKAVKPQCRQD